MMEGQKYDSALTSVNSHKVPALTRIIAEKYQGTNLDILDYGGGKYDNATEFLKTVSIKNRVYDPFNRTPEENNWAMSKTDYSVVMLSNVLNVIAEKEIRLRILHDIQDHMASSGSLFIKIYEGNRSGIMTVNEKRKSCQLNKKTSEYLPEVLEVFKNVRRERIRGVAVIIAEKEEVK